MRLIKIILLLVLLTDFAQAQVQVFNNGNTSSQRRIIFNGNSHFNLAQNSVTVTNNYHVPITIYNNLRASYKLTSAIFAVGGNPTTTINNNFNTQNLPVIRSRDVVVIWEVTNDLSVNNLTGQQAYDELVEFANSVHALGAYVIVATTIPRNHVDDAADIWTRGQACNTLIRSAPAGTFDAVCDLAADPVFDAEIDCDNTTYYNADKLHLATAGQNQVISLLTTTISNFLATL